MSNLAAAKSNEYSGLIRVMNNADIDREKSEEIEREQSASKQQQFMTSLASHIRGQFSDAYRAKQTHHDVMVGSLKQRKGEYPAEMLAAIDEEGMATTFMRLTDVKCRAAEAWIRDIINSQVRPWLLEATPVPDISPEQEAAMIQQAQMMIYQMGVHPMQAKQMLEDAKIEIKRQMDELAANAAERMTEKIEDQLAEGGFEEELDDFIYDVITYRAGVLKGPVVKRKPVLKWTENFQLEVGEELSVSVQRISPFDVYPGAHATKVDDGPLMVRHKLLSSDLYDMMGVRGNKDDAIRRILEIYGDKGYADWLERIDTDREVLEGREHWSSKNYYEALEYRGPASGKMLLEWGVPAERIDDPLRSYEIEAWLIGREVVRCVLSGDPLGKKPFGKASAVRTPGSWWGEGIPELMADIQEVCNAVVRALVENVGMASGPQVALDPGALPTGESISAIKPWKIWQVTQQAATANGLPLQFFQPALISGELLRIYESMAKYADEVTGIPAYTYGAADVGGAGNTASGLNMLMGAASKGIKNIIKNIDKVVAGLVERLYIHNMLYDPDQSIKGDAKVKARGATALIQKETQQMRNMEMLQFTNNPVDMQIIGMEGRAEMLRHAFNSMDYQRDIVPDREALAQKIAEQQFIEQTQAQMARLPGNQDVAGNPMSGAAVRHAA